MNKINENSSLNTLRKINNNNSFNKTNKNRKNIKIDKPSSINLANKISKISLPKNEKHYSKKENSKKSEIKNSVLAMFNKKNTPNKLKIKRKNSKSILNNKISEEQKELDRQAVLKRIKNRELNHEIKRKPYTSNSKVNNVNNKQSEIEKTLNDVKNLNKEQQNKFSFYHILGSNHLYFFIPNSKYEEIKNNSNLSNDYEIIENLTLPQAFRPRMNYFGNIPKCIISACSKGNFTMVKNFETCNLIWKLLTFEKMRLLTKNLFPHQKFNHFPCTYQLGRKDNLFKHYKHFKRLFPELYNYMPMTYILPNDSESFEHEFKKNKKSIWIAKPVNMSRGRFIKLIYNMESYKKLCNNSYDKNNNIQYLISKYLDKPHLLNNKKYDLRIYVIVLSFTPLKIYLYYNGLVRFATEDYIKDNYDNIYIHLTNYSINKQNPNYKNNLKDNKEIAEMEEIEEENEQCDDSSKWSLVEYRNYFKKEGEEKNFKKIWEQIEDVVIKTMIKVTEANSRDLSGNKNNNIFELYGFDILVDEKFKVWLLEVNVNPSLHCNSPLDLSIKTDLIIDIFNLIGIAPFNHNNNEEIYNLSRKKNFKYPSEIRLPKINQKNKNNYELKSKGNENVDEYYKKIIDFYNEEKMRSEVTGFELIFPKKTNVEFYSKILKDSKYNNEANNVLWDYILNSD